MNLRRIVIAAAACAVIPFALTAAVPAQAQVQVPAQTVVTVTCDTVTSLTIIAIGMGNCDVPGGIDLDLVTPVILVSTSTGAATTCEVATLEANGTVIGVGCGGLGLPGLPGL